ncbi:MAG: proline--tRNA ligase, partial [Planctomycetota bacterium]
MRWSRTFIPTLKEDPAEAEVASHRLMIRAGIARKLQSGVYTYLPLGLRVLDKITRIIREEMNRAGAIELFLPTLQPIELWEKTGRAAEYGATLPVFTDRHGRKNVLGPTHEEVITSLVAAEFNSYKQLPVTLYQIQTKFRDEFRPRFGVLRSREFQMKDAYSFDASIEGLNRSYQAMYDAYCRIFERCGLKYVIVEAESGPIGGDSSHEFMVPTQAGEDIILRCEACGYAANLERCACADGGGAVPPGGAALKEVATPGAKTVDDVCKLLNVTPDRLIKTLIFEAVSPTGEKKPFAVLVRGHHDANEAKVRRAGAPGPGWTVRLADAKTIEAVTKAPVGFAGPVGLSLPIFADFSVRTVTDGVTGANKADAHVTGVMPGRDFTPTAWADLRNAVAGDVCPRKGCGPLIMAHGIEVGHVFKLGTKYSEKLDARFLDEKGQAHPMIMGCYGIGVNRILASAIEIGNDADGILWPAAIAPFEVLVVPTNMKEPGLVAAAEKIYNELTAGGLDVLMDDRDLRAGVKFK